MDMNQEHLHPQAPNPAQQKIMAVAELLSDPKRWAKTALAGKTADGYMCEPQSAQAVAWCISGAFRRLEPNGAAYSDVLRPGAPVRTALERAYRAAPHYNPSSNPFFWNDYPETTHAQVMQLLADAVVYAGETTTAEPA